MNNQYALLYAWSPVIGGVVTFLVIFIMLRFSLFAHIQDIPNSRSLHDRPIPRVGGIALMLGIFTGWSQLNQNDTLWLYAVGVALMLLSMLDDIKDLPAKWRLFGHLIGAVGFVSFGLLQVPLYFFVTLVVALVWMINLYNFMDGANGLAGGMAAIGFSFYALAAAFGGDMNFALTSLIIVGSSIAFLMFNFGKAKVFMGDAGSIPLGFLSGAIGLIGWQKGLWPIWFPGVIFSSFIIDATVTLFKRLLRGERFWEAHREHYYQRLIQMGWSHKRMAFVEYILMSASGFIAMLALHQSTSFVLGMLAVCLTTKLALMLLVDQRWNRLG